jgi:hypothetical protein
MCHVESMGRDSSAHVRVHGQVYESTMHAPALHGLYIARHVESYDSFSSPSVTLQAGNRDQGTEHCTAPQTPTD